MATTAFNIGYMILIALGNAIASFKKWLPLVSCFYGPFTVVSARHPYFVLKSLNGWQIRRGIHARRLVRNYQLPPNLQESKRKREKFASRLGKTLPLTFSVVDIRLQ